VIRENVSVHPLFATADFPPRSGYEKPGLSLGVVQAQLSDIITE
jgi:hypothetical protein